VKIRAGSLKSYAVLLLFLFSGILVFAVTSYVNRLAGFTLETMEYNIEQRLLNISKMGASLVSPAELDEYREAEDMKKPEYQALRQKLLAFSEEAEVLYVYYIREENGKLQFIVDNDFDENTRVGLDTPPSDPEMTPGIEIVLSGRAVCPGLGNYSAGWDGLLAALAPVFDADGRVSAICGIDIVDESIVNARHMTRMLTVVQIISVAAIFLSGILGLWMYRREAVRANEESKGKTVFLARMRREISAPISAIIGSSEQILREETSPVVRENAVDVRRAGMNLLSIINNALDFSEAETGEPENNNIEPKTSSKNFQNIKEPVNPQLPPLDARSDESNAVETKHLFVINPISFGRQTDMNAVMLDIQYCFSAPGSADYSVYVSRFPRAAVGKIREYAAEAGDGVTIRVYAVGGDGILFDCLNGVVGLPNAELAVVPYGNSNDFLRAFGEGKEKLFRDIKTQTLSGAIPTDVIFCGNNYALNTCTIGMEAYTVHKAAELNARYTPRWNKFPPRVRKFMYDFMFFWGGIISSFAVKITHQNYTVLIDGEDVSGPYTTINIANGPCYGGDKNAAIAAMPDDGRIDVMLFKSTNTFHIIRVGMEYIYGKYHKFPSFISYIRASEITVRSDQPLVLQLDGEIFLDTNITIKIIPAAVRIVAAGNTPYERRAEFRG
jgi:YegS/Rv2252/BmrU family lipid kinase